MRSASRVNKERLQFNEGWIEFQDHGSKAVRGSVDAATVIAALVSGAKA